MSFSGGAEDEQAEPAIVESDVPPNPAPTTPNKPKFPPTPDLPEEPFLGPSRMTKETLATSVARRTGMTTGEARRAVEATITTMSDELAAGGEVAIAGFGKFSVSYRAARQGRNPSTGKRIYIPASRAAKFSAASKLKKRLN